MLFMKFGVTLLHTQEKIFKSPFNLSWYNFLHLATVSFFDCFIYMVHYSCGLSERIHEQYLFFTFFTVAFCTNKHMV